MIRRRGLRQLLRRRIVIYTKDDRTLRGVLLAEHKDTLAIVHAEYLNEAQNAELPAEVQVPLTNVSFVQALPAMEPA